MTERGIALLESMVALAIVSAITLAVLTGLQMAARSESLMHAREATLERADHMLAQLAILDRESLEQRIGEHVEAGLVLRVARPSPTLFRLAISDTSRPDSELLVTLVHRAVPQ